MSGVTVSRSGDVVVFDPATLGSRRHVGWVDRHHQRGTPSRQWRWVQHGGAFSPQPFTTRAEAVAALLVAAGVRR